MSLRDVFGLGAAIIGLAGLAIVIGRGGDTARILSAAGNSFSGVIRAATGPATGTPFQAARAGY